MVLKAVAGNLGGGGGSDGGNVIAAGTQTAASTGTVLFSNANGVTFGMNASSIVTASFSGGTGGTGAALSAGTQSIGTGTVAFANSNGITFGMSNSNQITASHNGLTSQSNQAASAANGSFAFQTISFSNVNGISFGTSAGSAITASHNGLTSQSNQALSAGNGSFTFQTASFADSNGVSFSTGTQGLYATVKTDYLTSQSNQALSGSNGSYTFQTASFGNLNGVSFYTSNGSMVASYTVPSTAGLLSAVNLSAGTTSNNLSAFTLSNSNGISFGLNGSVVTGSHNGLTSQSNQALSAGNGSFAFQTATFADSNGISFSTGTQGIYASHNGLTSQSNQALSAANGSFTFQTATFANSNGVSFSTGTQGIYATVKTDYLTTMQTHNSVYHSGTIFPGTDQYVGSAFMEYGTVATPSTPAANRMKHYAFAENGKVRQAVITPDGTSYTMEQDEYVTVVNKSGSTITKGKWVYYSGQDTGVPTIALADKDSNSGDAAIGIVLEDIANDAFGRVQLKGIATSMDTSGFSAGDYLILDAAGAATTSTPAQSFILLYVAIVLTSHATTGKLLLFPLQRPAYGQEYYFTSPDIFVGNTAGTRARIGLTVSNKVGVVQYTGTNNRTFHLPDTTAANATLMTNFNASAGTTSNNLTNLVFSNSNGVSFGLNGSTITGSHNGVTSQTNQTIGFYATSNTTQGTSGTQDARSLTFVGAGAASVGVSNGSIIISAPNAGAGNVTFSAGTSSAGLASLVFSNSNGVSFGLNGSTITASIAGGGGLTNINVSAGTTSNNLSALTFSNGSNVSFGLNGSVITGSVATSLTNINVSAGTTSNNLSAITFSNSNNISFGLNGSVVTANANIQTLTRWVKGPNATVIGNAGNNSRYAIGLMKLDNYVSASQLMLAGSAVITTAGNTSSAYHHVSVSAVLYTRNGSTLSSFASGATNFSAIFRSDSTNSVGGPRAFPIDIGGATLLSPGDYWLGFIVSTTNSATNASTATTALNCNYQMLIAGSQGTAVQQLRPFGAVTADTGGLYLAQGVYSAGTNATLASVAISDIIVSAQSANLGNAWVELRNGSFLV